jgi:hypothetical protein
MSLLMDALKQQNQGSPQPAVAVPSASSTNFWQWLALALLVVIGVFVGFLLAQMLQGKNAPEVTPAEPTLVTPALVAQPVAVPAAPLVATPGLILSDLLAVPVEEEQLVVSADAQTPAGDSWDEQVAALESFDEQPPMVEADVSEPVVETPAEMSADEVSQELKDKFQFALESSSGDTPKSGIRESAAPARDVRSLDDLLQRQIPPIRFEAHVFASEPKQRWVKVNGKDLQEGQWVTADIQIKEITPNYVLMQTGRQLFSMEALSEWSYRLKR